MTTYQANRSAESIALATLARLTDAQRQGLRDYFLLYEAQQPRINDEFRRDFATHPVWGPVLRAAPQAVMDEQNRVSLELLRRAIFEGEWSPLLANMREQGTQYAEQGLAFAQWFEILGVVRAYLLPPMVEAWVATPTRLADAILAMDVHFDIAMSVIGEAYLETKEGLIHRQQEALAELSAPVLPVRERLLLLPIVGVIDSQRARQITDGLLAAIRSYRARVVVIDITGVPAVDSKVANHLLQTAAAARLMGATPIMTGLSPEVAQALVLIGVDLRQVATVGDLRGGIEEAERIMGFRLVRANGTVD